MKLIIVNTFKKICKALYYIYAEKYLQNIDYKSLSNIYQAPMSVIMMASGKTPLSEISKTKMELVFILSLMYF